MGRFRRTRPDVDPDWPFWVRVYYADDVKPPKIPGDLAVETRHQSEISQQIEIQAAEGRKDVGKIESGKYQ